MQKLKRWMIIGCATLAVLAVATATVWLRSDTTRVENAIEANVGTPVPVQMIEPKPTPTTEPESVTFEEVEEEIVQLTGAQEYDEGYVVGAPRELTYDEILVIYKERALEDERYETVIANRSNIPESLLKHLANNPELISFLEDYPGGKSEDCEVRDVELEETCPLFLQWDKRWGYDSYGNGSNIAISGCGPTSLAMVVVALTGEKVSPADVAKYSMENNFYQKGFGTLWSLMSKGAEHYGLTSKTINWKEDVMKAYLDAGQMLIISVRPGDFTLFGHFMVIYGYDEEGFCLNDPMCIYKSKQKWTYAQLKGQIKGAWALGLPGGEKPDIEEPEETSAPEDIYEEQDPEGMTTFPETQTPQTVVSTPAQTQVIAPTPIPTQTPTETQTPEIVEEPPTPTEPPTETETPAIQEPVESSEETPAVSEESTAEEQQ